MDELKKLEQEFNLNSEDCKSPLKKKLKSNTAATIDLTTSASPSSNHHYHGLSESEIDRIKGLKKFDLIAELDAVGGEYKKHWTKPVLIDAYLDTLADQKFPPAQTKQQIDDAVDSHLLVGNNVMAMEIDSNIVLEKEESMKIEPLPVPVRRHSEIVNLTRNSLDNKIYSTTTPPKQGAVRRAIAATEEKVAASEMARETAAMTKTSMTPGKVGRLGMPLLYSSATVEDHAELAMIFNHSGSKMIHNPALDFQSTNTGSSRVVDMGSTTINETVDLESTILSKPSYFVQNKEATTTSLKAPTSHGSDSKVDRPFPISESSSNTKTAQSSHRPPVYATPTVNSNDAKSVTSDNAKKARVAELKAMVSFCRCFAPC